MTGETHPKKSQRSHSGLALYPPKMVCIVTIGNPQGPVPQGRRSRWACRSKPSPTSRMKTHGKSWGPCWAFLGVPFSFCGTKLWYPARWQLQPEHAPRICFATSTCFLINICSPKKHRNWDQIAAINCVCKIRQWFQQLSSNIMSWSSLRPDPCSDLGCFRFTCAMVSPAHLPIRQWSP